MKSTAPTTDLDSRFSSPGAIATNWSEAARRLEAAEIYWLSTVRPPGQPHITPLIGIWNRDRFSFCTGADEQKAKNLASNTRCTVTTGCNVMSEGTDVVVEGEVLRIRDDNRLQALADAYASKYEGWIFTVRNGLLIGEGGEAIAFEVVPKVAFAFTKGEIFSQTRFRF
jgi:pyridoxine/pyridoxamine 5'-phosphate oxidase